MRVHTMRASLLLPTGSDCRLFDCSLRSSLLGNEGARALAAGLETNRTLTELEYVQFSVRPVSHANLHCVIYCSYVQPTVCTGMKLVRPARWRWRPRYCKTTV